MYTNLFKSLIQVFWRLNFNHTSFQSTSFNKDFTCFRIYQVFSNCLSKRRVLMLFLLDFVTTNSSQVITTCGSKKRFTLKLSRELSAVFVTWTTFIIPLSAPSVREFGFLWISFQWCYEPTRYHQRYQHSSSPENLERTHKRCEWNLRAWSIRV